MTARRVLITQERIVQVDDSNELKCGERCQFLVGGQIKNGIKQGYCRLDGAAVLIRDRNRTEACTSGDVRAMGGGK